AAMGIYLDLLPAYQQAETLHQAEHTALARLAHWDDDETIETLWQAGALPPAIAPLFPNIDLKLEDGEHIDPLETVLTWGNFLLLRPVRAPIIAMSGLGHWASWSARRMPLSPRAHKWWGSTGSWFKNVRETVDGTNWARWGKVGKIGGKILPWTSLALDTTQAINDWRNGDYGWFAYHFVEAIADYGSFTIAAPVAAPISALMATGELGYIHRAEI